MTQPAPRKLRAPLLAGVATAMAVATLAIVLVSGGGGPQIDAAAQLASAGPQSPAPAKSVSDSRWLTTEIGGVRFPYWEDDRGWKSYGARTDKISGRSATTVYYRNSGGQSVAYTIVDGKALPSGQEGHSGTVNGTQYRFSESNGVSRVVWTRGGHTCILTARDVSTSRLEMLVD